MLQSFFLQTMFIQKTRGTQNVFLGQFPLKAHHFPLKSSDLFILFIVFFLFSAVRKKARNGTNGKKDTFFGLIFFFQKTEPVKNYFFACSKLGAFGVILTMQLEPPKTMMGDYPCIKLPNSVNTCPTAYCKERDGGSPTIFHH